MIKNKNVNYNSMISYVADYLNYDTFDSQNKDHEYNHLHLLIRIIIKFYVDLRCKYDAKKPT